MALLGLIITVLVITIGGLIAVALITLKNANSRQADIIEQSMAREARMMREAGRLQQFITEMIQRDIVLGEAREEVSIALRQFTQSLEEL